MEVSLTHSVEDFLYTWGTHFKIHDLHRIVEILHPVGVASALKLSTCVCSLGLHWSFFIMYHFTGISAS